MVSLNPSIYGNPVLALGLYKPEVLAAHQAKPTDAVVGLPANPVPGDGNVDDFIYDPAGKFTAAQDSLASSSAQEVEASTSDRSANFWEHLGSFQENIDADNPAYRHFQQLIAENGGYERNVIKDITANPQGQAMKDAVVREEAPNRANDLIKWTSGLNSFIAASKTEQYQTDEAFRSKIDALSNRLKGIISNDVRYLTSETDVSGPLILANDDGSYSIPDFILSYKGESIYSHKNG